MGVLRKVREDDAADIVQWRNDNAAGFPDQPEFTLEAQRNWYQAVYLNDPADHMYVVASKRPVGTLALHLPDGEVGRVLLGDRANAEPGIMSVAIQELMDLYGRDNYWLRVLYDNARAIRFYQKNGFQVTRQDNEYFRMETR